MIRNDRAKHYIEWIEGKEMMRFRAFLLAAVGTAAWAAHPTAQPGTLNYVEGQASVDGRPLTAKSASGTTVEAGQVLSTNDGHAEMLLTPGVFLRLGRASSVRMVSPGLTDTRVEILKGRAMVEATDLHKNNHISLLDERANVSLLKNGLYQVDGDGDMVSVYDGKAEVSVNDRNVEVKGGHEFDLNSPVEDNKLKTEKFDKKDAGTRDPLYQWSRLRSEYLGEATASYPYYGSSGFAGGWYWNPGWNTFAFLPSDGFLYSPFGYGLYSPWAFYGGGYGYYGRPVIIRRRVVPAGGRVMRPSGGFSRASGFSRSGGVAARHR